jgi:hypothetical protein
MGNACATRAGMVKGREAEGERGAQEAMPGRGIGSRRQLVCGRRAVLARNTAALHTIAKVLCADSLANTANGVDAARVESRAPRVESRESSAESRPMLLALGPGARVA